MKVLIVCSGNAKNFKFRINQAFIYDQVEAIKANSPTIEFGYFFIRGKGYFGYLGNLRQLRLELKNGKYDFIHAHSGDSIFLANLQRIVPVIGTFHGSDLNRSKNRMLSNIGNILSKKSIVVSKNLLNKLWSTRKVSVIPCGVDFGLFYPENKQEVRTRLDISDDKKLLLFASSFNNKVKNYDLLKEALYNIEIHEIETLELTGYERNQVRDLMNAVDVCVLTSFSEGSPQFIKEAMACNKPIVATNVGDIKNMIGNTEGCFVTSFEADVVRDCIVKALRFNGETNGRYRIRELDNKLISQKIVSVYESIKN